MYMTNAFAILALAVGALGCSAKVADVDDATGGDAAMPPDATHDSADEIGDAPTSSDTYAGRYDGPLPSCDAADEYACSNVGACQSGLCCRGTLMDGVCRCGMGSGCDILNICCQRLGTPDGTPSECVRDRHFCDGFPH